MLKHLATLSTLVCFCFIGRFPVPTGLAIRCSLVALRCRKTGRFTADREERLAFAETNPDEEYDDVVPQEAYVPRRRWAKFGGSWRERLGKRRCVSSRCIFGVGASKTGCTWMYI